MAKFVYRMQNILNIKYKMEAQAKSSYASTRAILSRQQEILESMFAEKRRIEDEYRRHAQGSINVRDLIDGQKAIEFQKESIKGQIVEVRVAEKNFEMARARLNDSMRERKTQEKLREKAFDVFVQELNAQEKKEIDELVSYRYSQTAE